MVSYNRKNLLYKNEQTFLPLKPFENWKFYDYELLLPVDDKCLMKCISFAKKGEKASILISKTGFFG